MVRLVGLEPTTGKSPADFKPAAYANFATAAPATRLHQHSISVAAFKAGSVWLDSAQPEQENCAALHFLS
jgi:hypothetical protein